MERIEPQLQRDELLVAQHRVTLRGFRLLALPFRRLTLSIRLLLLLVNLGLHLLPFLPHEADHLLKAHSPRLSHA